ncbi:MAG: glycosyltransferase family 39 protein [Acidobacteria bacterium]|nr:glycosyltransferase family 39 protein [Acidobacteriota bacterium]
MNASPFSSTAIGITPVALALALATASLGLRFGTFAASGADSYGYVSQADLWLEGRLIMEEPLADEASWRNANWTLTPFGYRPGDDRGTMVPTYAPGLPMVMAVFKASGGATAVFWVVPLLGGLSVWLTFLLGARIGGPSAGLLAAAALLASPPFLFQLMWPMSDVPAMAWWLVAIVLAVRGTTVGLGAAGLAAALAVLTRPNLLVLAVPILVFIATRSGTPRDRIRRAALFTAAVLPGPIAVAAINQHLYGSALASGYGTFSNIYASRYVPANLANYTTWLLQTQTPFIFLGLAAPWVLRRRGPIDVRPIVRLGVGVAALVALSYLAYTPFDHWTFLRFLLPAFPVMLALASAAFAALVPSARRPRAVAFAAVAIVLAGWGLWTGRAAFRVRAEEARYVAAGRFARELPEDAVILCNQHSGSLRYYANRITMRFEWLEPELYGEALDHFRRLGRPVFVVLDDWERDVFRARYASVADLSWLDEPPLLVAARRVYFYAVLPPAPRRAAAHAGL